MVMLQLQIFKNSLLLLMYMSYFKPSDLVPVIYAGLMNRKDVGLLSWAERNKDIDKSTALIGVGLGAYNLAVTVAFGTGIAASFMKGLECLVK
jgi:hypothetical protein